MADTAGSGGRVELATAIGGAVTVALPALATGRLPSESTSRPGCRRQVAGQERLRPTVEVCPPQTVDRKLKRLYRR